MKLKRTMIMTALAGVLLASCVRENVEPESYDRFYLNPPQFCGDSKLSFDHNGLWWGGGEMICINGNEHRLVNEHGVWHTEGSPVERVNGKFYVIFPAVPPDDWNESALRYGPYNFVDDQIIPLAIAGTTNRLTLWPCCAVIRSTQYDYAYITVTNGAIAKSGYIQPGETLAQCNIVLGEELGEGDWSAIPDDASDDGVFYFVLPIVGDEVDVILDFGDEITPSPVRLQKGYFYDLN